MSERHDISAGSEDALEETKGRIARAIYEVSNRWIQGNFPEDHVFLDFSCVDERTCNLHFDYADAVLAVMPAVPQQAWQCLARKQGTPGGNAPADCDWPGCGCDPHANKVLEAIDEAGFEITKKPEPTPWDAYRNRSHEPVETLAKVIYDAFVYNGPAGTTKPAWTPGGNGTKQDEAREEARSRLRQAGHTPALSRPNQGGGA